jgi:valyl-tRNA synthetase
MSKSKGNVVTPMPLLERHGADALRYWAAGGRPGVDTAADEGQMKIGRRLAIKVANVTKFVLTIADRGPVSSIKEVQPTPVDLTFLSHLESAITQTTTALENFDYTRALEIIEKYFWDFCDNYVELVKIRAYGEDGRAHFSDAEVVSARSSLLAGVSVTLRLLAPFLPFICEEAWSWWQEGSIHRSPWPSPHDPHELYNTYVAYFGEGSECTQPRFPSDLRAYALASEILGEVRRAKSEAKQSMKAPLESVTVQLSIEDAPILAEIEKDLRAAGVVERFILDGSPLQPGAAHISKTVFATGGIED